MDKLEKIGVDVPWYSYLGSIEGFEIKNLPDEEGRRTDNVICKETSICAAFDGNLKKYEIDRRAEFEGSFQKFKQLSPDQRKTILQSFV